MAIIGGIYKVTNSHFSSVQQSSVRVKTLDGVILAEVFPEHSDALRYVRTRPQSQARKEFVRQLRANDVPEEHIKMLLAIPPKKGV